MKYIILYDYGHYDMGGYGWHFCNEISEVYSFIDKLPTNVKSTDINEYIKVLEISKEFKIKPVDIITNFDLE